MMMTLTNLSQANSYSQEFVTNYILEYWHHIKTGQEVVSLKVYKQYKKLVEDINNPREPWIYDENRANHAIKFIEKYCKHSKGKWGGKPVILELWQKALIAAAFGFVNKYTRHRKYTEVLLIVARKNGKSTLAAAVGLYLQIADGEPGAEVYAVATKKDQAKIIWLEAKKMVSKSPALRKRIKPLVAEMVGLGKYESVFKPLGSDSDSLDGLNVHGACMDEIHAWKDKNLYDVIYDGMTAREQPMLFETSTAGTVRGLVYDEKYDYASKVIDGLEGYEDERLLAIIYELDDRKEWTQPECWKKANPGLGTIKDEQKLAEKVNKAKRVPDQVSNLLCKDFNVRDTVAGSWLTFDNINNEETYEMDFIRGSYAVGGTDLSSTTDLSCATLLLMKSDSEKKYVIQQYFLPEDLLESRVKEDKIPYDKWAERGLLTLCPGNKVVYSDVTKWYVKMFQEYDIRPLWNGYDPWNSQYWIQEMKDTGFEMEVVRQGAQTLSQPMKELAADLAAKRINYNNNPALKWCLTNTSVKRDENDNIRPVKGQNQRQRIDGAVSLLIAYTILFQKLADYKSLL
jgi:phage terminase large subunit-like protein